MKPLQAQKRNVPTVLASTRTTERQAGLGVYFRVARMDWLPRPGLDLDFGMRVSAGPPIPSSRPHPHAIGALNPFMPLVDYWKFRGNRISPMVPGPIVGSPEHSMLASAGQNGYLPKWYRNLIKSY